MQHRTASPMSEQGRPCTFTLLGLRDFAEPASCALPSFATRETNDGFPPALSLFLIAAASLHLCVGSAASAYPFLAPYSLISWHSGASRLRSSCRSPGLCPGPAWGSVVPHLSPKTPSCSRYPRGPRGAVRHFPLDPPGAYPAGESGKLAASPLHSPLASSDGPGLFCTPLAPSRPGRVEPALPEPLRASGRRPVLHARDDAQHGAPA